MTVNVNPLFWRYLRYAFGTTFVRYVSILHRRVIVINQRTNGPVNAHLISGLTISTITSNI